MNTAVNAPHSALEGSVRILVHIMITHDSNPKGELDTLQALVSRLNSFCTREALIEMTRGQTVRWSFEDLATDVMQLARGLAEHGVGCGTPVMLFAGSSVNWVKACLAIYRCGACVVPVDAQFRNATLQHVLQDSQATLVFVDSETVQSLRDMGEEGKHTLIILDDDPEAENYQSESIITWQQMCRSDANDGMSVPEPDPGQRAALFYTSGTTGKPKGVPLTHKNLIFQIETIGDTRLLDHPQRILQPLPLHHVYPFVLGMIAPLAFGCPLIFPAALTGPQLVRAIREEDATLVVGVPRLYSALIEGIDSQIRSAGRIVYTLTHLVLRCNRLVARYSGRNIGRKTLFMLHRRLGAELTQLASGGAALDPELAARLRDFGWDVIVGYGLTETSPLITLRMPEDDRFDSVGSAVQNVEIKLDREAMPGNPDASDIGEVLVRGPNVFSGYHNLPEETRQVLDQKGWFRTGDLGNLDNDGFLYLRGRRSTMIVTPGGENLQPEIVEAEYSRHPVISEIGVFQQDDKLVAVVVPDREAMERAGAGTEGEITAQALQERARQLPSYMQLTEHVVSQEPIARTRLGKIRRHLLADHFESARTNGKGSQMKTGAVPIEQMSDSDQALLEDNVARKIWQLLANRYPDQRLAPDTDMRGELGLDSLAWVSLTLDIRRETGVELDEATIASIRTVRDLLHEAIEAEDVGERDEQKTLFENPAGFIGPKQMKWLQPLNLFQRLLARMVYGVVWLSMKVLFRVRVVGRENLPAQGPAVLAPNHTSYLDPFALITALGYRNLRQTRWAGWTGVAFQNFVFRGFSRLAQALPIDAQRASISSLALAAAALKRGDFLVWFPEGQRSLTGELQRLQGGLGIVLNELDVPVCPINIAGTYSALPPGKFLPRPCCITVTIGPAVYPGELSAEGAGDNREEQIIDGLRDRLLGL